MLLIQIRKNQQQQQQALQYFSQKQMFDGGEKIPKKRLRKIAENATRTTARSAHATEINKAALKNIKATQQRTQQQTKQRMSCEVEIREMPLLWEDALAAPEALRWQRSPSWSSVAARRLDVYGVVKNAFD